MGNEAVNHYAVDIGDTGVCKSLFWADERARSTYMKFSDVIVFDVTYKTNTFLLPFAPFTGVNHHRQSTLFGCGLLADEQETTFVWLFSTWMECMFGNAPKAIITDQDPAISKAIEHVFPNTCHRYCSWHITLHEDEHLRPLRAAFGAEFNHDYKQWTKRSETIDESEMLWNSLNERYNVEDNDLSEDKKNSRRKAWKWMQWMYSKRHHWVEGFLKTTFFAGMKSSQRSESVNAFFDGFVSNRTPLVEFVHQYEEAINTQRIKEEFEDKECLTKKVESRGIHEIEKHAAEFYTRKIFEIFLKEFRDVFFCKHQFISTENEEVLTYNILSRVDEVESVSSVTCSADGSSFTCSCANFETMGILCKHVLYIMKQKFDFTSIPEKYLLSRWSMKSRYSTSKMFNSSSTREVHGFSENKANAFESWKLRAEMNQVLHFAENNRDVYVDVLKFIAGVKEQYGGMEDVNFGQHVHDESPDFSTNVTILDPKKCVTKGRPPAASRYKSGIEKCTKEMEKRFRTCSKCGGKGHDVRTCNT